MPKSKKMIITDKKAVYHINSYSVLDGFPIENDDKDFFISILKKLSQFYFVEIYGFCVMSTHFHILAEVFPEHHISAKELKQRIKNYYDDDLTFDPKTISYYRRKLSSLSEFVKQLRQSFSVYYNKKNNRRGTFWGSKFKSAIIEKGNALIYCMAYIDLNPVRAGIAERPEVYRWSSVGYRKKVTKKNDFLSFNIGIKKYEIKDRKKAIEQYLEFIYQVGSLQYNNKQIENKLNKESDTNKAGKNKEIEQIRRFRRKHRYFIDSGVIGSKEYVSDIYWLFKDIFLTDIEKKPKKISGVDGIYSMKRLSE